MSKKSNKKLTISKETMLKLYRTVDWELEDKSLRTSAKVHLTHWKDKKRQNTVKNYYDQEE